MSVLFPAMISMEARIEKRMTERKEQLAASRLRPGCPWRVNIIRAFLRGTHDPQSPLHHLRCKHGILESIVADWVWPELFVNAGDRVEATEDNSIGGYVVHAGDVATITNICFLNNRARMTLRFDKEDTPSLKRGISPFEWNSAREAFEKSNKIVRGAYLGDGFQLVEELVSQQARVKAYTCVEPVTFRETISYERDVDGVTRRGNCVWHFPGGIAVGRIVYRFSAWHSGFNNSDHDEIQEGNVTQVQGDRVSICWTKHVERCQQDLICNWARCGPYEQYEHYDFRHVNMSWTGLEGFTPGVNDLTPEDAILTIMHTIKCLYNGFHLTTLTELNFGGSTRSTPESGWKSLTGASPGTALLPTTTKSDGTVLDQVVEVMKENQRLEATRECDTYGRRAGLFASDIK